MSRFYLSALARNDLDAIWDYIGVVNDRPAAARRLVEALFERFAMLSRQPLAGEARDDVAEGVRSFSVGNYVIYYRPVTDGVRIARVLVNAYERNPAARRACKEHYGATCCICGFDFGEKYGPIMDGFIHVHHLHSLSESGGEYVVNPVADLRPVCPNCHAVLHSRRPAYSVEEVRAFLERQGDEVAASARAPRS